MNVKEINSEKLFKEFLITIPYEEIDNSINLKLNEIIPTVSLPGFRKGKAPIQIVKKKYENSILNEVVEKIVKEKTNKLINDKKIKAFRQPRVDLKKYKKNEPVEILIQIDLQPNIEVFPFEKIKLQKYNIKIDKKIQDENYKSFMNSQVSYVKIENNRNVKMGDKIFVDIESDEEKLPDHLKKQKNVTIITDSDFQILPDISNKLINSKIKMNDSIKLKFDSKKIIKEFEKNMIEFKIKILSIEEKTNFKINDNFLKQFNVKNENELKENFNKNLKVQYEQYLSEIEKKHLMDILEQKNEFDISKRILDEEFNIIWHRLEHAKKDNKLDEDDKKLSEEKLKNRYKKIASRRVKLAILMQHIANINNITVTDKELSDGMINYASQYPGQEKQIFEYFKSNPTSVESIRGPIFEKKVIDLILSKVKRESKNITTKEFDKLQEETFNFNRKKND